MLWNPFGNEARGGRVAVAVVVPLVCTILRGPLPLPPLDCHYYAYITPILRPPTTAATTHFYYQAMGYDGFVCIESARQLVVAVFSIAPQLQLGSLAQPSPVTMDLLE